MLCHVSNALPTQLTITCSKLAIEALGQRCKICSKFAKKTPKLRYWRCFGVFIINFEHISRLCSSVSIVNFEQVNAGCEVKKIMSSFYDH